MTSPYVRLEEADYPHNFPLLTTNSHYRQKKKQGQAKYRVFLFCDNKLIKKYAKTNLLKKQIDTENTESAL
jgi:hypothetical protein